MADNIVAGESKILCRQSMKYTTSDRRSETDVYFEAPPGLAALLVRFSYFPKNTDDHAICKPLIDGCFDLYWNTGLPRPDWREFLPLDNLITISLDHEGCFAGCAHRHAKEQCHVISAAHSSPGFHLQPALEGRWRAVISLHEIVTPSVQADIEIEGVCATDWQERRAVFENA